jgi:CBS domain-containing protein
MARYDRGYGREYRRRGGMGQGEYGGMRSDAGGGNWWDFPGEEGWFGQGYEGWHGEGFERGWGGPQREPRRGYGGEYRGRGMPQSQPGDAYMDRDAGYSEGWRTPDAWGPRGEQQGRRPSRGRGSAGWGRTRAADIMTENPEAVTPDVTLSDAAQKMRDLDVGIIPVVDTLDNRRLRGVITDRDIAIRGVAEGRDGTAVVSDCMTDEVETVNKNDSIQDVMRIMRNEQVRRVPVTDREGRLVGIVAQADLAVDYAGADRDREMEVGETLERISEPAHPNRPH